MIQIVFVTALAALLAFAPVPAVGTPAQVKPVSPHESTVTTVVKATSPSQKAKKKAKPKPVTEPVQYAPSGEAMPAREKRLLRECKGRPNAGACLGYAS